MNIILYRLSLDRGSKIAIDTQFEMGFASIVSLRYSQSLQKYKMQTGVAATHLDWTMVPYVRKSFHKHFKDGMKYIKNSEVGEGVTNETPIDDEKYKGHEDVYAYAMDMTEKELKQAVEGMYHNLKHIWAA